LLVLLGAGVDGAELADSLLLLPAEESLPAADAEAGSDVRLSVR
jgi:hypothetical protein